mmetsp:Transcript_22913/g.50933  ORF Transcript_22913/g.50933 Transcript_22913/m.50933 type:complete len:294 (-) Transcript_22913:3-884(-)
MLSLGVADICSYKAASMDIECVRFWSRASGGRVCSTESEVERRLTGRANVCASPSEPISNRPRFEFTFGLRQLWGRPRFTLPILPGKPTFEGCSVVPCCELPTLVGLSTVCRAVRKSCAVFFWCTISTALEAKSLSSKSRSRSHLLQRSARSALQSLGNRKENVQIMIVLVPFDVSGVCHVTSERNALSSGCPFFRASSKGRFLRAFLDFTSSDGFSSFLVAFPPFTAFRLGSLVDAGMLAAGKAEKSLELKDAKLEPFPYFLRSGFWFSSPPHIPSSSPKQNKRRPARGTLN